MADGVETARLLGVAQLAVFAASVVSERLLLSVVGSGGAPEILVSVSKHLTRMRVSNLVAMLNCLAIVVLGALFYAVLGKQFRALSLVALGCFLAEAITLAVSKIGAYALIPISRDYVAAGAPAGSHWEALGELVYRGVDRRGYDIHMLFFCAGAIIWYWLLNRSGTVPQALSAWGIASIALLSVPVVAVLYNRDLTGTFILGLPYAPFELVLGLWLLVKGAP